MNVNTNLYNVLASQTSSGGVPMNNQMVSMNKGEFLNFMKMLMAGNENPSQFVQAGDAGLNPDILQLLANSMEGRNVMDNLYQIETDKNSYFNEYKSDKEPITDKIPVDLYGMMVQLGYSDPSIISPEIPMANMSYNILEPKYSQNYTNLENFNTFQNMKHGMTENQQQTIGLETQSASEIQTKADVPEVSFSAEKLIAEIEGNKNKLKNEIDFRANLLAANNKPAAEGYNKVITISDESSEIKSQVLSQVKEKIVFMTEEKPGTDNTVKHVTMELQPNNLGKVDIKMTLEDDKLTVEIKALNKETQKILESNVEELADILNKATKTAVDVVVKSNDYQSESRVVSHNQHSEHQEQQNYNQNNDEANQQGKNKDSYHYSSEDSDNEEEDVFSQMINLRNIKLNM